MVGVDTNHNIVDTNHNTVDTNLNTRFTRSSTNQLTNSFLYIVYNTINNRGNR